MEDFDNPKSSSIGGQNIFLYVSVALLIGAMVFIFFLVNSRNRLTAEDAKKAKAIITFEDANLQIKNRLDSLDAESIKMTKELEDIRTQKEKLISSRDSVLRLLNYSRVNEKNAQAKVTQLQKKLTELQKQLTGIQQRYDELLATAGSTDGDLRRQVEALTAERNALATENQKLQRELQASTGNADNRTAIFTTKMTASPGEVLKGKFSRSTRSQNTDRIEVSFSLSRAPKPTESLIFKIFDRANKEVAIKPKYRNELNAPANPTNQKVILEFETGKLDRKASGTYSVRMFLTDVNKGLENQEIGITQFEVK